MRKRRHKNIGRNFSCERFYSIYFFCLKNGEIKRRASTNDNDRYRELRVRSDGFKNEADSRCRRSRKLQSEAAAVCKRRFQVCRRRLSSGRFDDNFDVANASLRCRSTMASRRAACVTATTIRRVHRAV